MTDAEDFVVERQGEVFAGPVRRPGNASQDERGSIHDDATAQKLGFRGGTVAASIHLEQFPPLMEAVFGEAWLTRGGLSLYFLTPTLDGEPVRAFASRTADTEAGLPRADVWMLDAEGVKVCEGSATLGGPDAASALSLRLAEARAPGALRLLKDSQVGDTVEGVPARIDPLKAMERLERITEPLACYRDPSRFGGRVAAPVVAVDLMRAVEGPLFRPRSPYVGMFGAIEVQMIEGPVFIDRDYLVDGKVLALSESPKTEAVWYESILKDPASGATIARMIMLSRLLKASSSLWA